MIKPTPGPEPGSGSPHFRKRAVIIILDGVGIGAMPDAFSYGDEGAATLPHVCRELKGLALPRLQEMGLGNITPLQGIPPSPDPRASFGSMSPISPGKDTTTGHWEIAGLTLDEPFPVYPRGFPPQITGAFSQKINRSILGNKAASGTEIIEELGTLHLETGAPIVYTSADSVFQIAAHEGIVPVETLYQWCTVARELLRGDHAVSRVIARPFTGIPGKFQRTARRKDFSLPPPGPTILDLIWEKGGRVTALGKVYDIFNGRGINRPVPAEGGNESVFRALVEVLDSEPEGLIWANFNDFDTLYGHRNDTAGFARALEDFDRYLEVILKKQRLGDMFVITADHGCDPTHAGTDHTREYVPLLVWGTRLKSGVNLGTRTSLADAGAAILHYFGMEERLRGISFLDLIRV